MIRCRVMKIANVSILFVGLALVSACTKSVGKDPSLAYSDRALYDSASANYHRYYKNDPGPLLSGAQGSNGQHGAFKLRFNHLAFKALQDSGKLPVKTLMPEGALVIKDVYEGGKVSLYAIMYKHAGSWLWAEIKPGGQVLYGVKKDPSVCTSCHSQTGNRDFLRTFTYY